MPGFAVEGVSFHVRDCGLAERTPGRGGEDHWFLTGLFVAAVQHNRLIGIVVRLTRARDSDDRAKVENACSFCLGDALERCGESRRSATVKRLE
jgi:hypothetical protein